MLVYRIEDAKGRGAYSAGVLAHNDNGNQPAPYEDRRLWPDWIRLCNVEAEVFYRFGFKDLPSLTRWFNDGDWRQAAQDAGLFVAMYEVEDGEVELNDNTFDTTYSGDKQVIFHLASAKRVGVFSLNTLDSL